MRLATLGSVFLVLAIGQIAGAIQADNKAKEKARERLSALCKREHFTLHTVDDLGELIGALDEGKVECSAFFEEALRALAAIVKDPRACTLEKAEALASFSKAYLNKEKLPKALHTFAVAYGLKMSTICQHHMLKKWLTEAEYSILEYHFNELNMWLDENSAISRLLEPLVKKGEFMLPADLWAALPNDKLKYKVIMLSTKKVELDRAKEVCSKRFMPLMEPIVLPITTLARAGFIYKDAKLKEEQYLYMARMGQLADWSKVMFICELLKSVEVAPGSSLRTVSHFEEERVRRPRLDEEDHAARDEGRTHFKAHLETAMHVADDVLMPNEILHEFEFHIKTAVLAFDPNKSDVQRMQAKLLKRGWRLLAAQCKYGLLKSFTKAAYKNLARKLGENNAEQELKTINKGLIEVLDAKGKSRLYKFIVGLYRFGKALVAGLVHFVATVTVSLVRVCSPCCPRVSNRLTEEALILQE